MTKVNPVKNPFYMPDDMLSSGNDLFGAKVKEFKAEIFRVTEDGFGSGAEDFSRLMLSMFPYNTKSDLVLNTITTKDPITKTWTKEGDILICVEYLQLELEDEAEEAERKRIY